MADNPYDIFTSNLTKTEAQSRFTKTPIVIKNLDLLAKKFAEALSSNGVTARLEQPVKDQPAEGLYTGDDKKIRIQLYGSNPTYKDLANAIHHEDIHALLDQSNQRYPQLANYPQGSLIDKLLSIFQAPQPAAERAFFRGNRGGNVNSELPAYVGAYNPTQLPGFNEAQRQQYLNLLYPSLGDKTANIFRRIVASHDASQGF